MNPVSLFAVLFGLSLFCLILFAGTFLMWSKKNRPPSGAERRALARIPVRTSFDVMWQDREGRHKRMRGRAVDISERGACLTSFRPLPRNAVIYIKARRHQFEGSASVRYCRRSGLRYVIGVELRGPLTRSDGVGA